MAVLIKLYLIFFKIGLFSIGGGYASLPLIKKLLCEGTGWISLTEFTDIIIISQMTPGPIAINAASFVGTKVHGIPGAIIATIGSVTPSLIIILIISFFYFKYRDLKYIKGVLSGLRPATVGLIGSAGISIATMAFWNGTIHEFDISKLDYISVFIFIISFIILRKFKIDPIKVMLGSGVLGVILYSLF